MLMNNPRHQPGISGMSLNKIFLFGNTSAFFLGGGGVVFPDVGGGGVSFPDEERKTPGNYEIPELFPVRKSLIGDIPGFPSVTGITT